MTTQTTQEVNVQLVARKLLKFLLNAIIWFFIVPAIIDIYLYVTQNKLITDSLFGAKRQTKDHLVYFAAYAVFALTWMAFGITLILNAIYVLINNESFIEKITNTKTTFSK